MLKAILSLLGSAPVYPKPHTPYTYPSSNSPSGVAKAKREARKRRNIRARSKK